MKRMIPGLGLSLIASCAESPPHIETREASDRATITSTRLADGEWRVDFVANLDMPPTTADSFMPRRPFPQDIKYATISIDQKSDVNISSNKRRHSNFPIHIFASHTSNISSMSPGSRLAQGCSKVVYRSANSEPKNQTHV